MSVGEETGLRLSRWASLLGSAVAAALGLALLLVAPSLVGLAFSFYRRLVPWSVREYIPLVLTLAVAFLLQARPEAVLGRSLPVAFWTRIDAACDRLLRSWLTPLLGVTAVGLLACWLPHYLTWPWWPDTEHFAVTALSWDRGVLPYRDLFDFNFPGPVYLMWMLGKLAGWGRTSPLYALDAAMLIGLGVLLVAWSHSLFGKPTAGLIGLLAVLSYYLAQDTSQVAQRDWVVGLLAVSSITALQAFPGRLSRFGSALGFAAALAYRPYAILFLPAVVSALGEEVPGGDGSPWTRRRSLAVWVLTCSCFVALAILPLVVAGVIGDFLRCLSFVRPGGEYYRIAPRGGVERAADFFVNARPVWVLVACLVLALRRETRHRNSAWTWALALVGAALFRPLSPVPHDYLAMPAMLVAGVALGFCAGEFLGFAWPATTLKVWVVGALLAAVFPVIPRFCNAPRSLQAVRDLALGGYPAAPPPGCAGTFRPVIGPYLWGDYCRLLEYLKANTGANTVVANVLRREPFPPVNGPVARRTPFPSVSGLIMFKSLGPRDERRFADRLEAEPDAVVVWVPDEPEVHEGLELPEITRVIRRSYEPEARFGIMEVWRRKKATASGGTTRTETPVPCRLGSFPLAFRIE